MFPKVRYIDSAGILWLSGGRKGYHWANAAFYSIATFLC